jgi:hypothetical protein
MAVVYTTDFDIRRHSRAYILPPSVMYRHVGDPGYWFVWQGTEAPLQSFLSQDEFKPLPERCIYRVGGCDVQYAKADARAALRVPDKYVKRIFSCKRRDVWHRADVFNYHPLLHALRGVGISPQAIDAIFTYLPIGKQVFPWSYPRNLMNRPEYTLDGFLQCVLDSIDAGGQDFIWHHGQHSLFLHLPSSCAWFGAGRTIIARGLKAQGGRKGFKPIHGTMRCLFRVPHGAYAHLRQPTWPHSALDYPDWMDWRPRIRRRGQGDRLPPPHRQTGFPDAP